MKIVTKTDIDVYPLVSRGKVRDIYEIDADTLLMITTDRMSAFDVILPQPVPYKGVILNSLTLFWMKKFENIIPNHILESDVKNFPAALRHWQDELEGRSVIVRKAKPLPVECIVRGYITGSGWESYKKTGEICEQKLPAGLVEAQQLTPALFTPTTKGEAGIHDEALTFPGMAALTGDEAAQKARLLSLALYDAGAAYAKNKGIIVADTKFELGYIDGELHLIDEVLTPDSSRFWPAASYQPGHPQPSFDKQYLRDWLKKTDWNHEAPAPDIPESVIKATEEKYQEAYKRLVTQ